MNVASGSLLLLATALLVAACAVPAPQHNPGVVLENTEWRLIDLGGQRALAGPSLRLDAEQIQARGSTGCNTYFGRYELAGQQLRFGPLASTRRACVDPEMNRQESAFLKALDETRAWRIAGDTLVLREDSGELARFASQSTK
jgi:heat shock protein HslJ